MYEEQLPVGEIESAQGYTHVKFMIASMLQDAITAITSTIMQRIVKRIKYVEHVQDHMQPKSAKTFLNVLTARKPDTQRNSVVTLLSL